MKKILAILSIVSFLFIVKSPAIAIGDRYCNFSPTGANGQAYGDVTLTTSCVIYEAVNGTANGNLTLQNTSITVNRKLVFPAGKQINVGSGSYMYLNSGGSIVQRKLCVKDADSDGYADTVTLSTDPANPSVPLANPITQIGKVEADAAGTCPSGYRLSELMNNLAMVDANTGSADSTFATSDYEFLRLGFSINGMTDAAAAVGDIVVPSPKNLIVVGGNVGIGTTAPLDTLQVNGGLTLGGDTVVANRTRLYESNGLHIDTGYSTRPMLFEIDSSEKVRIDTAGNVGIGTTNPTAKLYLQGATGSVDQDAPPALIVVGGSGGSTTANVGRIGGNISLTGGIGTVGFTNGGAGGGITLNGGAGGNGTGIVTGAYGNIILANLGGNVGIGTTSVGSKLVVNGDTRMLDQLLFGPVGANVGNITWDANYTYVKSGVGKKLSLSVNDTLSNSVVIDTLGNVGIGTTNPGAYKLNVNGSAYFSGGFDLGPGYTAEYTTDANWSSFQTVIPTGALAEWTVYLVTLRWDGGASPYYADAATFFAVISTNGTGTGTEIALLTSTHQGSSAYLSVASFGGNTPNGNGLKVKFTNFASYGGTFTVRATKISSI